MFFPQAAASRADRTKLYDVLELSPACSQADIKKAYRKCAMIHHPDKGGTNEAMKAINAMKKTKTCAAAAAPKAMKAMKAVKATTQFINNCD